MSDIILSDMVDEIILMTGNAFLGDLDTIGFTTKNFVDIVRNSLRDWTRYRNIRSAVVVPYNGEVAIKMSDYVNPAPKLITKVMLGGTRISYRYAEGYLFINQVSPGHTLTVYYARAKQELVGLVDNLQPDTDLSNWKIAIDKDTTDVSELYNLVSANFKIALGGATRRFTIQEMPIGLDGDQMLNEGKQEKQEVIQQLQETQDSFDNLNADPEYTLATKGFTYGAFRFR